MQHETITPLPAELFTNLNLAAKTEMTPQPVILHAIWGISYQRKIFPEINQLHHIIAQRILIDSIRYN